MKAVYKHAHDFTRLSWKDIKTLETRPVLVRRDRQLMPPRKKDVSVFMAVKTTAKYRETRIPLLEETWASDKRIDTFFMTDKIESKDRAKTGDDVERFIDVGTNQEKGYCGKMK